MRYVSWLLILIVIVIVAGAWFFLRPTPISKLSDGDNSIGNFIAGEKAMSDRLNAQREKLTGINADLDLSGKNFSFSQKEIRVKKGAHVRVHFTSESGFHDWVVDELGVRTKRLNSGESDTVEFTADKAGTFAYYCSVGNHRQMGMEGKLIVE